MVRNYGFSITTILDSDDVKCFYVLHVVVKGDFK